MKLKLIFFVLSIVLSVSSHAKIYTKTFPLLIGYYKYDKMQYVSYDFGVQFSSIQKVSIEVMAAGANALLESCVYPISTSLYPTFPIPTCPTFQAEPRLSYEFQRLSASDPYISGSLAINTATSEFKTSKGSVTIDSDILLEGKGNLLISHLPLNLEATTALISTPTFQINGVTLTIEAETAQTTSSILIDKVFNDIETTYSQWFSPSQASIKNEPFYYRCYPSNACIGEKNGELFYHVEGLTDKPTKWGAIHQWYDQK